MHLCAHTHACTHKYFKNIYKVHSMGKHSKLFCYWRERQTDISGPQLHLSSHGTPKAATLEGRVSLISPQSVPSDTGRMTRGVTGDFGYKGHTTRGTPTASKGRHNSRAKCIVNCLGGHFLGTMGADGVLARVRLSSPSTPIREGQLWPEIPHPRIPQLRSGDEPPACLSLPPTILKLN